MRTRGSELSERATYRSFGVFKEDLGRVGDTELLLSGSSSAIDAGSGLRGVAAHEARRRGFVNDLAQKQHNANPFLSSKRTFAPRSRRVWAQLRPEMKTRCTALRLVKRQNGR